MTIRNREVRAVEYRRLAKLAYALGEAAVLEHVRQKHQVAAAKWETLAELDERPVDQAPAQAGMPATLPA